MTSVECLHTVGPLLWPARPSGSPDLQASLGERRPGSWLAWGCFCFHRLRPQQVALVHALLEFPSGTWPRSGAIAGPSGHRWRLGVAVQGEACRLPFGRPRHSLKTRLPPAPRPLRTQRAPSRSAACVDGRGHFRPCSHALVPAVGLCLVNDRQVPLAHRLRPGRAQASCLTPVSPRGDSAHLPRIKLSSPGSTRSGTVSPLCFLGRGLVSQFGVGGGEPSLPTPQLRSPASGHRLFPWSWPNGHLPRASQLGELGRD